MKVELEITENDLKDLIMEKVERTLGDITVTRSDITIEVKSKQNYRSEWEPAAFRARVRKY